MYSILPSFNASDEGWRATIGPRCLFATAALTRAYQRLPAAFQEADTAESRAGADLSAQCTGMHWLASSKGVVRFDHTRERSFAFCTFLHIVFLSRVAGPNARFWYCTTLGDSLMISCDASVLCP